jgi:hypothetical protein
MTVTDTGAAIMATVSYLPEAGMSAADRAPARLCPGVCARA